MMNYVYIIECSDGTLYTGWTNNLDKRIEQHCNGTGAKYTRGRGPVTLVYHEEFNDKRDAMRREYEIKRYSRINKLKLIENMQKYDKK
ncbi:GIY-YIG domain protein [Clostridium butyricum 5521]|uniref:Excinuclease ABC, C subunit domain protein n=2 Tax=Clostridium butyricum TaxID=1492 RepID=C4IEY0_CLOBU|nr:GIY-YIG domain protein [Clostridium butyricum 5521]EEP55693.1 excinuclease ABC, C subunit domain protein [Clostridium butyricum E4 str. BoNT E BL5262]